MIKMHAPLVKANCSQNFVAKVVTFGKIRNGFFSEHRIQSDEDTATPRSVLTRALFGRVERLRGASRRPPRRVLLLLPVLRFAPLDLARRQHLGRSAGTTQNQNESAQRENTARMAAQTCGTSVVFILRNAPLLAIVFPIFVAEHTQSLGTST